MAKFGLNYQEEQRAVLACRESCESCASMSIHSLAFRTFSLHRAWDGNLEWAKSTAVLFEKVVLVRSDIVFFGAQAHHADLVTWLGRALYIFRTQRLPIITLLWPVFLSWLVDWRGTQYCRAYITSQQTSDMFFSELIETTRTAARPSADGIQIDTRPSPTVYNHVGISTNFEHASTSGSSEKGHLLILSPGLSGHTTATHLASHTGTTHSSEETLNSTPGMEVEESHQSPPMGLIIGSVLGGIFGIALITMAAIFVRKVHKSNMETLGCGIELVKTDKRTIDEDVALSQFLATGCADSRAREVGLKKLEQALKRKWAREKSALRSPGSVELEAFEKRKETERRLLLAASLDTLWTTRGEPSVRESQTG